MLFSVQLTVYIFYFSIDRGGRGTSYISIVWLAKRLPVLDYIASICIRDYDINSFVGSCVRCRWRCREIGDGQKDSTRSNEWGGWAGAVIRDINNIEPQAENSLRDQQNGSIRKRKSLETPKD